MWYIFSIELEKKNDGLSYNIVPYMHSLQNITVRARKAAKSFYVDPAWHCISINVHGRPVCKSAQLPRLPKVDTLILRWWLSWEAHVSVIFPWQCAVRYNERFHNFYLKNYFSEGGLLSSSEVPNRAYVTTGFPDLSRLISYISSVAGAFPMFTCHPVRIQQSFWTLWILPSCSEIWRCWIIIVLELLLTIIIIV